MKLIIIVSLVIFAACGGGRQPAGNNAAATTDTAANEKLSEKNKLIAAKNEASEITRLAQKLEQHGRDMQPFRETSDGESARQCKNVLEERSKAVAELDARIGKLPDDYKSKLMPLVGELNECVSCARKSLNDCKKARASINQTIKELFP